MFKFFERLTTAFPKQEPDQPPKGLYAFCRHYTKGFEVPLISMSLLSAVIAMIEVSLFALWDSSLIGYQLMIEKPF